MAGDFLRSTADTSDVEIDIVGANEWDHGRDHLLLPGDDIYLPADAVRPPSTTATTAEPDEAGSAWVAGDPDVVCDGRIVSDSYAIGADVRRTAGDRSAVHGDVAAERPIPGCSSTTGTELEICYVWFVN